MGTTHAGAHTQRAHAEFSHLSPAGLAHLQHVHLRQPPKGAICQLADVVSLKLQHLQAIQSLERESLDQPNPIPIEVTRIKP